MGLEELPESARRRVAAQRASGVAGSLLSAPAVAALRGAGMAPAGEVFGCVVTTAGWTGPRSCGGRTATGPVVQGPVGLGGPTSGRTTPVRTTESGRATGWLPYARGQEAAWRRAVDRLLAEAAGLGADGVVGVTVERRPLAVEAVEAVECTALGTAVRVLDRSLVARDPDGRVWAADLSAEDVAAAVHSGQQPRGIAFGFAVAVKHEDWLHVAQMAAGAREVAGLTGVLRAAQDAARRRIRAEAARLGGGVLVVSRLETRRAAGECGDGGRDHRAETLVQGTVLGPAPMARFRTRDRPGTARVLPVIPLGDARRL